MFTGAIVDENGIIENILVFDNEEILKNFKALLLIGRQRIGDPYLTPEEYQKRELTSIIKSEINSI